jgi:hypothetical protein
MTYSKRRQSVSDWCVLRSWSGALALYGGAAIKIASMLTPSHLECRMRPGELRWAGSHLGTTTCLRLDWNPLTLSRISFTNGRSMCAYTRGHACLPACLPAELVLLSRHPCIQVIAEVRSLRCIRLAHTTRFVSATWRRSRPSRAAWLWEFPPRNPTDSSRTLHNQPHQPNR